MQYKTPGVIAIKSLTAEGTEYEAYYSYLNKIIKNLATNGVGYIDESCVYEDRIIKATYEDNDYGNTKLRLEISREYWDNLPPKINPFMVNGGGPWNLVYESMENKGIITFHIPGEWVDLLSHYLN